MKLKFNKLTQILLSVIIIFGIVTAAPFAVSAATTAKTINLALKSGTSNAYSNFVSFKNALTSTNGTYNLCVVLPQNGTYYIDTTGSALVLRPNTTIDLNGSTIVRSGDMLNQNMFQNADGNGNRTKGGYTLTQNITIKNGTIDGNGSKSSVGVNLLNFGHTTNLTISDVNLKNAYQGHLIELSGCKDSVIKNCSFSGFYGNPTGDNEAIQLDTCKKTWNGVYYSDSTVCKNITVESCVFNDYPSGVGNHHTLTKGYHNQKINIIKNKFYNSKAYSAAAPAIRCYGFDNSTVKDNIIKGIYSDGIKISGGNVDALNNNIDVNNSKDSSGIYITYSSSNMHTKDSEAPGARTEEYVTDGLISGNTITKYDRHGISVNSYSTLNNITANTISTGKGNGIYITRSTVSGEISNNKISGCKYNNSDNIGSGIHITSTSWVKNIKSNTIKSCAGYGIVHNSTKVSVNITNNKLSDNKEGALKVSGTGTISGNNSGAVSPTSIKLNQSSFGLGVGESYTLTKTISPSNAVQTCSWSSSNTGVATVSSSGKVTAKKAGTATITVKTSNGKKATCNVTVKPAPTKAYLNIDNLVFGIGESYEITESTNKGSYARNFTFSSSNTKVATVARTSGHKAKITAKAVGTATITVKTYNGKKATCKVTVV